MAGTLGCAGLKVGALLWTLYNGEEPLDAVVWPEKGALEPRRVPAPDEEGFAIVPIGDFHSALFSPFMDDCRLAYPEQRAQLLSGLEATGGKKGQPGYSVFEALVGPGANEPTPSPTYPHGDPWEFSSAVSNYTTFQLDPLEREARVRCHAGDGRTCSSAP